MKTALFLDAGYLDKLVSSHYAVASGGRKLPLALDFRKLPEALAHERPWRVFYYYCMPYVSDPPLPAEHAAYEAKARFIEFLARQKRWVLRQGVLEKRGEVLQQKRVDVALAVDLVRLAWRGEIARAVVLAGDSDFVPAVLDARAAGVKVDLLYGPQTVHEELVAACDTASILTREALEAVRLPPSGPSA